jgi:hypothetical protein
MKLVATRDIFNVPKLNIRPDSTQVHAFPKGKTHAKAILKGMRFSIGSGEKGEDLLPEEKDKVLWLHHSKAIVAADDKAVERIDREVKADLERDAREATPAASVDDLIAKGIAAALPGAVAATLKAMGIEPKK